MSEKSEPQVMVTCEQCGEDVLTELAQEVFKSAPSDWSMTEDITLYFCPECAEDDLYPCCGDPDETESEHDYFIFRKSPHDYKLEAVRKAAEAIVEDYRKLSPGDRLNVYSAEEMGKLSRLNAALKALENNDDRT